MIRDTASRIIEALADAAVHRRAVDVRLGLRYVGVQLDDESCGVAYRFTESERCNEISFPGDDLIAGREAGELLSWLHSENLLMRSVGLAAANALTGSPEGEVMRGDIRSIIEFGADEQVAMVGYFEPLVEEIRKQCALDIYEIDTSLARGLKESSAAPEGLGRCDVALLTSTAIVNGTIDRLIQAAKGCREVVILGPSTPLIPEAFAGTSVTLLSGVVVVSGEILKCISEGGGMQRFKPYVRKVNCRLKT